MRATYVGRIFLIERDVQDIFSFLPAHMCRLVTNGLRFLATLILQRQLFFGQIMKIRKIPTFRTLVTVKKQNI